MSPSPERWRLLEELYRAAVERAPVERAAFLREACPDEELRREVESLLGFEGKDDTLMRHSPWASSPGIQPGMRLGPYEIESRLGAGGMGEVWKARDTRLGRSVAVKVSKTEFSKRFEREARAIAALNHPNIAQVYDVGENYLVMEFVDGAPVRSTDDIRKLLDIALQIADGLSAAHSAGIVHRDLKPDNVLITKNGRIKILDFGLAKQETSAETSVTNTATMTEAGMVVGTVDYMSPEQARGQALDHRSDQFSFGLILYELATGTRAFRRETAAETMAAIIRDEAEPLPSTIPAPVRWTIERCMAKEPDRRYDSTRDLYRELLQTHDGLSKQAGPAATAPAPARKAGFRWDLAVLAAIVIVALAAVVYRLAGPVPQPTSWTGALLVGPDIAYRPRPSPDGHLIAFYTVEDACTQVALMEPETGNWSILTHSRQHGNVTNVTWAPDGTSIYYDRATAVPEGIYSVPLLGGDERLVVPNAFRPEALPDGSLLANKLNSNHEWQLFRFWPETGRVQDLPFAAVDVGNSLESPRVFPNGREAVIDGAPLGQQASGMRLLVVDLATGAARPLAPDLPMGTGTPGYAVSRDGKSVLVAQENGEFTRVLAVPAHGEGPAKTLFTATNEIWGLDSAPDGSVYACVTDLPAELVSRPPDRDQTETLASFPEVSDPDLLTVLPDGRVVLTVLNSERARLVAVERGKHAVAMIATTEETATPATVAGPQEIAFLIGPVPRGTIALADTATGRITRRISPGKGEIVSLAASPDGSTLYFASGGIIWSIPSTGGDAHKIRVGNRVIIDPAGRALLVSLLESPNPRLFRISLDGADETEVPVDRAHALRFLHLSPGSWNANGHLLTSLDESWFAAPAVLDTRNGRVQPLPTDKTSDYGSMVWLPDGRMIALRIRPRSTLWRFAPERGKR